MLALFSVFLVVIFLLIFEGMLGLCGFENAVRYRQVTSPDLFAHDDTLGWVLRPGASSMHTAPEYSVSYGIDDRGMRLTPASREGVSPRVWCLGGSMTFGHALNDDDTMPNRLAEMTGSQVWNLGVQAYGTDQSLIQFRRMLRFERPDVVILSYLPSNLERNASLPKWTSKLGQSHRAKPKFRLTDGRLQLAEVPGSASASSFSQSRSGSEAFESRRDGFFLTCENGCGGTVGCISGCVSVCGI
jgi:hypothetical protein